MASPMNRKRNNRIDITLMTLLANEATSASRKLLKEYKEPDAKDYKDLEVKLAELYFKTPDKVVLEKKLAEIHPHRKWIMKNVEPIVKTVEVEKKSSADAKDDDCVALKPQFPQYNPISYFDAMQQQQPQQPQYAPWEKFIAPIMMLSIIGLTFVVISRTITPHK